MTKTLISLDDYEIEIDPQAKTAMVHWGRFQGYLHDLERTGYLYTPSGKAHKVPAWVIGDLANLAYQNGL